MKLFTGDNFHLIDNPMNQGFNLTEEKIESDAEKSVSQKASIFNEVSSNVLDPLEASNRIKEINQPEIP